MHSTSLGKRSLVVLRWAHYQDMHDVPIASARLGCQFMWCIHALLRVLFLYEYGRPRKFPTLTARSLLLINVVPEIVRSLRKFSLRQESPSIQRTMFLHVIFPSLTQPFSIIGVLQRS